MRTEVLIVRGKNDSKSSPRVTSMHSLWFISIFWWFFFTAKQTVQFPVSYFGPESGEFLLKDNSCFCHEYTDIK